MAVEIHLGRFYCTTSEVEFGPVCASDKEAEMLAYEVERTTGADVRVRDDLAEQLADLRSGEMLTRETHSSRACYCGSGKPWVSKLQQLGKPSATRCADCSGTEEPGLAKMVAVVAPSDGVVDLFDALKGALGKGQASTL